MKKIQLVEDSDNAPNGVEWLFRVNDNGTKSIAQLKDVEALLRQERQRIAKQIDTIISARTAPNLRETHVYMVDDLLSLKNELLATPQEDK